MEIAFWYLLLTINSFTIVIDFGFYPTFSRIVSFAYHGLQNLSDVDGSHKYAGDNKPNWDLMKRVYGTINSTYLFLGILIVGVIFSFTYLPVSKIIHQANHQKDLWGAYFIYAFSVFFAFVAKKFDAVIIGTKNIVIINRWDIINNALNTLSSILIVFFKLDLIYLAFNQLFFSILLVVRDYFLERSICNKKFREFKIFSFHKDVFNWCWGACLEIGNIDSLFYGCYAGNRAHLFKHIRYKKTGCLSFIVKAHNYDSTILTGTFLFKTSHILRPKSK
jgi:hypothetical protein